MPLNKGLNATDGCDTRKEVILGEAVATPQVGAGSKLTGGSWRSPYDNLIVTDAPAWMLITSSRWPKSTTPSRRSCLGRIIPPGSVIASDLVGEVWLSLVEVMTGPCAWELPVQRHDVASDPTVEAAVVSVGAPGVIGLVAPANVRALEPTPASERRWL
ncbi:hypothetical protein ACIQWN_34585 [Streptomyces vinaceus]|uniref:hypothetical protein n=1 Tax=Streptomyces vinaceus TaxID=1960 RepID=UPI0038213690